MPKEKDEKATETTPAEQLEAKIDAMMDVSQSDPKPAAPAPTNDTQKELPPLDIFEGAKTAPDVPSGLLKELSATKANKAIAPNKPSVPDAATPKPVAAAKPAAVETPAAEPTQTETPQPELDDASSDAAIDEIVATEADTVLAAEDAESNTQASPEVEPSPRKIHHHPVFWTLIAILAVLALVFAYLMASGGNGNFPGSGTLHNLRQKL